MNKTVEQRSRTSRKYDDDEELANEMMPQREREREREHANANERNKMQCVQCLRAVIVRIVLIPMWIFVQRFRALLPQTRARYNITLSCVCNNARRQREESNSYLISLVTITSIGVHHHGG